jgi:hypothetical protein
MCGPDRDAAGAPAVSLLPAPGGGAATGVRVELLRLLLEPAQRSAAQRGGRRVHQARARHARARSRRGRRAAARGCGWRRDRRRRGARRGRRRARRCPAPVEPTPPRAPAPREPSAVRRSCSARQAGEPRSAVVTTRTSHLHDPCLQYRQRVARTRPLRLSPGALMFGAFGQDGRKLDLPPERLLADLVDGDRHLIERDPRVLSWLPQSSPGTPTCRSTPSPARPPRSGEVWSDVCRPLPRALRPAGRQPR